MKPPSSSSLRATLSGALALASLACASIPSKTPVEGPPNATARLVGQWEGTYDSDETGRSGVISFRLRAAADTAQGEIIMTAHGTPSRADPGAVPTYAFSAANAPITIRFVIVNGSDVTGRLDPYTDPECGCTLKTTFHGVLEGDVIKGTFHSEGNGFFHQPANGTWRVTRKAKA
jgi:hypothetical protein